MYDMLKRNVRGFVFAMFITPILVGLLLTPGAAVGEGYQFDSCSVANPETEGCCTCGYDDEEPFCHGGAFIGTLSCHKGPPLTCPTDRICLVPLG